LLVVVKIKATGRTTLVAPREASFKILPGRDSNLARDAVFVRRCWSRKEVSLFAVRCCTHLDRIRRSSLVGVVEALQQPISVLSTTRGSLSLM